jgi:TM2 domain-containing membrane protein YozV
MTMNENLPEPPTDAGLPTPEVPIDPPVVEDIATTVQDAASPMQAPAPEDLPTPDAITEAAPVEAPPALEIPAEEVAAAAPVEAPPAFEAPAAPVEPAAQVAPPAPPAPPVAPPAPPAPPVMAAAPVVAAAVATFPNGKPMMDASGQPASPKSRLVALLLILLFSVLGIQRFYVGKIGTGILYLITLGGFGIWFLIDLVMIIVGSFKDKQGRVLSNW